MFYVGKVIPTKREGVVLAYQSRSILLNFKKVIFEKIVLVYWPFMPVLPSFFRWRTEHFVGCASQTRFVSHITTVWYLVISLHLFHVLFFPHKREDGNTKRDLYYLVKNEGYSKINKAISDCYSYVLFGADRSGIAVNIEASEEK